MVLGGCVSQKQSKTTGFSPVPIEKYDEEVLKGNAAAMNMRYVDYLHALTNNKIPQLRNNDGTIKDL